MLCSVDWQFFTDVSGQPIGPILEGRADGTDALTRNVGKWLKIKSRNIPEEGKLHLHIGGNLRSRKSVDFTHAKVLVVSVYIFFPMINFQ
jgi:hypothetical protein